MLFSSFAMLFPQWWSHCKYIFIVENLIWWICCCWCWCRCYLCTVRLVLWHPFFLYPGKIFITMMMVTTTTTTTITATTTTTTTTTAMVTATAATDLFHGSFVREQILLGLVYATVVSCQFNYTSSRNILFQWWFEHKMDCIQLPEWYYIFNWYSC